VGAAAGVDADAGVTPAAAVTVPTADVAPGAGIGGAEVSSSGSSSRNSWMAITAPMAAAPSTTTAVTMSRRRFMRFSGQQKTVTLKIRSE
jgi:hypothetical protein